MTALPPSIADLAQVSNVALTPLVQQTQYQEIGLGLHAFMQALGYTVVASSNGVVAGAGNNIAVLADIVQGVEGVDPHSWAVYQDGSTYILINFDDAPAPAPNPQYAQCYRCEAPYVGFGSTVNRPTTTVGYEMTNGSRTIVPWVGGLAGYFSYQYSALAGIGWFIVKENGGSNVGFRMIVEQPDPSDPMYDGGPPILVDFESQPFTPAGMVFNGLLPASTGQAVVSLAQYVTDGWDYTPGQSVAADGLGRDNKFWMATNGTTQPQARFLGESRLFFSAMTGAPFNGRTPGDPDPFTLWILGDVTIYWLQAAGDIL